MQANIDIRKSLTSDIASLETLYPAAFPDEDLLPLLRQLLNGKYDVLSFVAVADGHVIGHIAFTICAVEECSEKVGMLAPLAVSPDYQRKGIGSALIQEGLNHLRNIGTTQVYVLGDPGYYGRSGFTQESNVAPPYALPKEWRTAWQSLTLHQTKSNLNGVLSVPEPWRHKHLWTE